MNRTDDYKTAIITNGFVGASQLLMALKHFGATKVHWTLFGIEVLVCGFCLYKLIRIKTAH